MADFLKIDDATRAQLVGLLGVSEDVADQIVATRPHGSKADLDWLPAPASARISDRLEIEKFNLNEATVEQLIQLCGLPEPIASTIVANRPYYLSLELRHLEGVDAEAFDAVTTVFTVSSLTYVDKLTGKSVDLRADSSEVLVRLKSQDSESAESLASRNSLRRISGGSGRNDYQVYAVSQGETGVGAIRKLKLDRAVDRVVPAFRNAEGVAQFIDPEFCVVQFKDGVTPQEQNTVIASAGLTIDELHRTPGLMTLRMRSAADSPRKIIEAVKVLNASSAVAFAEPGFIAVNDREGAKKKAAKKARPSDDAESGSLDWNLSLLGCENAWLVEMGTPDVVIALIDSGIDLNHPSLADGYLQRSQGESWNFEDDSDPNPTDIDGHGTFIAGLLIGNGQSGIHGICPGCRILPLRVPLAGASLSYARRRDAILYAINSVAPPTKLIISISWKTTGDVGLIRDAIAQATQRDALVVCSAGNWPMSYNEPHYPSDYGDVLSIAAVGADKGPADYSFFGDKIDLCAPGGSGTAADQGSNIKSAAIGGAVTYDFGTSFAVPHVVGAAALLLSHRSALDRQRAREILEASAEPLDQAGTGRGFARVDLALDAATGSDEGPVVNPVTSDGLIIINEWSESRLRDTFLLLPISIRIIIARRPFSSLEEVRGILGVSAAQYEQIATYAE
ncbi:S8 family serine peptidase [Mesorhizobium sp. STM 4661]|uniref:S8 family serine peptidase n=1 Tax=Mesorhizobium sp. STM 4661 TaxID=1297570 RepID=UPI0002C02407|nr:S8 family serine peptidase [Mesorhizobium sp. STM 4661]CCV14641.1 putative Thermitase [Mesorhizobium sp. STM 4661]